MAVAKTHPRTSAASPLRLQRSSQAKALFILAGCDVANSCSSPRVLRVERFRGQRRRRIDRVIIGSADRTDPKLRFSFCARCPHHGIREAEVRMVRQMSNGRTSRVRELIDRLFETLERAKLKDLERSIARAANEREVSQRVHRLEAGESPLS